MARFRSKSTRSFPSQLVLCFYPRLRYQAGRGPWVSRPAIR